MYIYIYVWRCPKMGLPLKWSNDLDDMWVINILDHFRNLMLPLYIDIHNIYVILYYIILYIIILLYFIILYYIYIYNII